VEDGAQRNNESAHAKCFFPPPPSHCNYPRIVFRAIALQRALKLHTTRSTPKRERWQRKRGDERAEKLFFPFYVHEATFSAPESLICLCTLCFPVAPIPSSDLQFRVDPTSCAFSPFRFAVKLFSLPLSFRRRAMKKHEKLAPRYSPFSAFLLLLVLLFRLSSSTKFHAKNSVFIMLLLLEPRCMLHPLARDCWRYITCSLALLPAFYFLSARRRSGKWGNTTRSRGSYDEKHKMYVLFDGSRLAVMQCSEII
jgi:hypothetical protein